MENNKGICSDSCEASKKVQVTIPKGIYDIIQDMKKYVYKTDSDSAVCASLIEDQALSPQCQKLLANSKQNAEITKNAQE